MRRPILYSLWGGLQKRGGRAQVHEPGSLWPAVECMGEENRIAASPSLSGQPLLLHARTASLLGGRSRRRQPSAVRRARLDPSPLEPATRHETHTHHDLVVAASSLSCGCCRCTRPAASPFDNLSSRKLSLLVEPPGRISAGSQAGTHTRKSSHSQLRELASRGTVGRLHTPRQGRPRGGTASAGRLGTSPRRRRQLAGRRYT